MAVAWTEDQKKVIETRKKNILVSAAAGSGKTAVLVERILSRIMDPVDPIDIDRLLVVTFTNAAAGQMRDRIRDALEQRAEQEPENVHLQKQLVLIHQANIMTIHSFCLQVLRSQFHLIGLDPAFRIADTGEMKLLEQEVVQEILEQAYQEQTSDFVWFLESCVPGKNDSALEQMILSLHHFSQGHPWPEEWLAQAVECYEGWGESEAEDQKRWNEIKWLKKAEEDAKRRITEAMELWKQAEKIAESIQGPWFYQDALQQDKILLQTLLDAAGYAARSEAFQKKQAYKRLSTKKDASVSEEKKNQVKELREQYKKEIEEIQKQYFYQEPGLLRREWIRSGRMIKELVNLTVKFAQRLEEQKREKNLLDFNDMEHKALQILIEENEEGEHVPSAAAREYAANFEEIMIDEYQDSNLVQEWILSSVAGREGGAYNRFMVGDVKQSIYRFRMARPELFLEKYKTYRQEENENEVRIDLHQNFRSRKEVLSLVNDFFVQLMTQQLGGICYDKEAALYPGATFPDNPGEKQECHIPELMLLETENREKREAEAEMTGRRIQKLLQEELVWDSQQKEYRKAEYRDIVILLRTMDGWAEVFQETLNHMGIPCFCGSSKGYFSAMEVRCVLSYLQSLDNPLQDIPFAAVLRSPIGTLSDEDLAKIRMECPDGCFYDSCREYQEKGSDAGLLLKLNRFFDGFDSLRKKTSYTPMHTLLAEVLQKTGYGEYAAALPGGKQRKANLDMLLEKAAAYEATSYRGLYHFVRYIENLKKYEIDYGEASTAGEADNIVRIMSIHKSKGLEFPIVFVSGLAKPFHDQEAKNGIVMHPEFGIACDSVDLEKRQKEAALLKRVILRQIRQENLGEELRVLYVAATRAKEKLIFTAAQENLEEKIRGLKALGAREKEELPFTSLMNAGSFLDWILQALSCRIEDGWFQKRETKEDDPEILKKGRAEIKIILQREEEAKQQQSEKEEEDQERFRKLIHPEETESRTSDRVREVIKRMNQAYPWQAVNGIQNKLTVSEWKRLSLQEEEITWNSLAQEEEGQEETIPEFMKEEKKITGSALGTLYHKVLQMLELGPLEQKTQTGQNEQIQIQLEEWVKCGKMSRREKNRLTLNKLTRFFSGRLGQKIIQAEKNKTLYREQPFVIGVGADEINPNWSRQETVLVQGMIDAFFYDTDGKIVVLDYKTDQVADAQILKQRYQLQLLYYAKALERLTGCCVKKKVIYSFYLGEEIEV